MATRENTARAAEGMTAEEEAYFKSGGTAELAPPADDAAPAQPDAGAAPPQDAVPEASQQVDSPPTQPQLDDDDDGGDPNAMIPRSVLLRERKKLRDRLTERDDRLSQALADKAQSDQRWARLDERFRLFQEAAMPPQQP